MQVNRAASVSERSAHTAALTVAAPKARRGVWLLLLLGGVAAAIVVIIRDKQATRKSPAQRAATGGSVEIKDNGKGEEKPSAGTEGGECQSRRHRCRRCCPANRCRRSHWCINRPSCPACAAGASRRETCGIRQAMAYRPDGKRLAVGARTAVIRIWEPETGRLMQVLLGAHRVYVSGLVARWPGTGCGVRHQKRPVSASGTPKPAGYSIEALETPDLPYISSSPGRRTAGAC